jgi:hypothetical protein
MGKNIRISSILLRKLFERKTLLDYIVCEDKPFYINTKVVIELAFIREHLGVRKIIEEEISELKKIDAVNF